MREDSKKKKAVKKVLLAGPWLGEMGWEIMTWIPAVRYLSQQYQKTIIICQPGKRDLYEFADNIIVHSKRGRPDRWLINGKKPKIPDVWKIEGATVVRPNKYMCYNAPREYYKYGKYDDRSEFDIKYDILIHARAMTKYGQGKLNWPVKRYEKLVEYFKGKRIACIGSKKGAHYIKNTIDMRGEPLGLICNAMANSRVTVGTSSAPLHLASLCGCPHVVMTGAEKLRSLGWHNNRWRYEKYWNPWKTPVRVVDNHGWIPPVKAVIRAIERLIGV
jgi:hypothetical protein